MKKPPLNRVMKMTWIAQLQTATTIWEYSQNRRPSIAAERLIRALLLQVLYTIRSERSSGWFVGLSVDEPWDHSTFSESRDRLLDADIARELFESMIAQARATNLLRDEHFSVDGTMIQAWASQRSFRPKDGSDEPPASGGRNLARDFSRQEPHQR